MKNKIDIKLQNKRHSLSHLLAAAVTELYPKAKMTIGPAIDNGFYYDFDFPSPPSDKDLPKIEKRMKEILKNWKNFEKIEISKKEAEEHFKDNPYKLELIKDLEAITFYKSGDFVDLCGGGHIESVKEIDTNSFKLHKIAGAYWRGDEKNKMLTRIYGLAFDTKKELNDYLMQLEEAEKRDHRKLGKELELFMVDDEVGQGLPLWMPKGALVYHLVKDFAFKTYLERGYDPVITPHIASSKLWQHSGHLDFYNDGMYGSFGIDEEEYRLKPMNCPLQVKIYTSRPRSYKELSLRWTEMGTVYRYERSGTLHGLTRVRGFTQDDAHIICTPDQLEKELKDAFDLTLYILKSFGFKTEDIEMNLSIRDPENREKFIGGDKEWDQAEKTLKKVLIDSGYKDFVFDVGGAVFYGPKIDFKLKDAIGRMWQLSTIQLDFNLPSRFKMTYIDNEGKEKVPFMIHRALLGSLERFLGILIEHYAGAFPLWLSPVQVMILPISENHKEYGNKIFEELKKSGLRVEIDERGESLGKKIRDTKLQKIPYTIVIGDNEVKNKTVTLESRDSDTMKDIKLEEVIDKLKKEIEDKE